MWNKMLVCTGDKKWNKQYNVAPDMVECGTRTYNFETSPRTLMNFSRMAHPGCQNPTNVEVSLVVGR